MEQSESKNAPTSIANNPGFQHEDGTYAQQDSAFELDMGFRTEGLTENELMLEALLKTTGQEFLKTFDAKSYRSNKKLLVIVLKIGKTIKRPKEDGSGDIYFFFVECITGKLDDSKDNEVTIQPPKKKGGNVSQPQNVSQAPGIRMDGDAFTNDFAREDFDDFSAHPVDHNKSTHRPGLDTVQSRIALQAFLDARNIRSQMAQMGVPQEPPKKTKIFTSFKFESFMISGTPEGAGIAIPV